MFQGSNNSNKAQGNNYQVSLIKFSVKVEVFKNLNISTPGSCCRQPIKRGKTNEDSLSTVRVSLRKWGKEIDRAIV